MNTKPIGVFDSGLGGLTTVRELRRILPGEDIVYFGDTGRVPYGNRGRETIIAYAKQDIAFLLSKDVKTIVAACGTVSSTLPDAEVAGLPVSYTGVVTPAAARAARETRNGRVGIIGTEATIASGCYVAALQRLSPGIESVAQACPLFVPLVESGYFAVGNPVTTLVAKEYLAPIKAAGVDTLIMGCTHYPLLRDIIRQEMGDGVTLVDAGLEAANHLRTELEARDMLNGRATGGSVAYYVTDDPAKFDHLADIFLGGYGGGVAKKINIEDYRL